MPRVFLQYKAIFVLRPTFPHAILSRDILGLNKTRDAILLLKNGTPSYSVLRPSYVLFVRFEARDGYLQDMRHQTSVGRKIVRKFGFPEKRSLGRFPLPLNIANV